jgi:hypothetical protein
LLGLGLAAAVTGHAVLGDAGSEWMEELHEAISSAIVILVVVHVAGVLTSSVLHRQNLIGSMITGRKRGAPEQGIGRPRALVAAALLTTLVAFWAWYPSAGAVPESPAGHDQRGDDVGE